MQQREFVFSEETIKQRKKLMWLIVMMMPIVAVIFTFLFSLRDSDFDIGLFLIIITGVVAFVVIELMVVSRLTMRKLAESRIVVYEDRLEHRSGRFSDIIRFADIKSIGARREKSGKLLLVRLTVSKRAFNVTGFEGMEEILVILRDKAPQDTPFTDKTYKIDWNSPAVLTLVMLITTLVLSTFVLLGDDFYLAFNIIFTISMGLVFLIYRPISRSAGSRFKLFEIICGGLILVSGIMILITKLL